MKTDPLTNKELEQYLSGEMTKEEMYQVELKLSSSEIYSDAVDGYESAGKGMAGFGALSERFHSNLSASGGSSSMSTLMITGLGIALVTMLGLSVANEKMRSPDPSGNDHTTETIAAQTEEEPSGEGIDEQVVEAEIEEELVSAEPVPDVEVITYKKTLENQPETMVESELETLKTQVSELQPESEVALEPLEMPEVPEELETNFDPEKSVVSNVKIVYLAYLKVVDFSALYEKKIKIRNTNIPSGTRVYFSDTAKGNNGANNPVVISGPYIYIDYLDYLNNAMETFYKNNFKSALKKYKVILRSFPDDVNAHFYGGLCYYNLGKPDRAIKYFNKVLFNHINTFDQEAEWYKALSLKRDGQSEEARQLLKKIAGDGKFYANRARKELKDLE